MDLIAAVDTDNIVAIAVLDDDVTYAVKNSPAFDRVWKVKTNSIAMRRHGGVSRYGVKVSVPIKPMR